MLRVGTQSSFLGNDMINDLGHSLFIKVSLWKESRIQTYSKWSIGWMFMLLSNMMWHNDLYNLIIDSFCRLMQIWKVSCKFWRSWWREEGKLHGHGKNYFAFLRTILSLYHIGVLVYPSLPSIPGLLCININVL